MPDIHKRALVLQALSDKSENTTCYFLTPLFYFFLNITMAKKLKQIDRLIDHTGVYFQEEMQRIVSITFDSRTPASNFLIITHLLTFSNFTYCSHI